eukprot:24828_1
MSELDAKTEFLDDLCDLEDRISDTWDELDSTRKRLNEDHKKLTEVLNRYKNLNADFKRLRNAYNDTEDETSLKTLCAPTDDVEKRLKLVDNEMKVIRENKLRVGSIWLRLLVGRVSMKQWDDAKRLQLKSEYHKFKYRTNFIFLLFPLAQLCCIRYYGHVSWILNQWHNIWLLYYYITLTTREVILKLNGSKLHHWWIVHHQISSCGAFICMLLMRSAYDRYWFLFETVTWVSLIVGLLQIWANQYQLKRHYVRVALGKDSQADIALTESIINETNTQSSIHFNLLKMCCYLVYLLELSVGLSIVFYVYWNDQRNGEKFDLFQFEAYACGMCFLALGIGNTYALHTRPSKFMHRIGSTKKIFNSSSFKKYH